MDVILLARCFVCLFFAVLFLQSGLDKVVDWTGNLSFLDGHFDKSFLGRLVLPLLAGITLMELGTGVLCLGSVASLLTHGGENVPIAALSMACLTLIMLFSGQRIVKDYPGAATITTYFGVAIVGLILMWPALPQLATELQKAAQSQ